jgi:carbamoyltransferase
VANGRIARESPFDQVFFQPVAGDAGTALGAASVTMSKLGGPHPVPLLDLRLGPSYTHDDVASMLDALDLGTASHQLDDLALIDDVAARLERGQIVGWFDGAAEFGPRALGARSILADPRNAEVRDRINTMLKNREGWRPLAPIVAEAHAATYFETSRPLWFMIETVAVRAAAGLDAITHVDGTARPQTVSTTTMPRLSALLAAFERHTGVPVLINTSFNHASEPIVSTPAQALLAASRLGLDALVLGDVLVTDLRHDVADLVRQWQVLQARAAAGANLYPL